MLDGSSCCRVSAPASSCVALGDPAVRWMLERPYVFVEEAQKIGLPWMRDAEAEAVADGRLKPVGGHECWLRSFHWLLLAELQEASRLTTRSFTRIALPWSV